MSAYVGKCSFLGVAFGTVQADGRAAIEFDQRTLYAADDIPYSSDTSVQISGRQSGEQSFSIYITRANWPAFQGKLRRQGTLNLNGVSITATLMGWSGVRRSDDYQYVLCSATWYI